MNGTIIDIQGISVSVNPYELQDSTDKAHTITIKDNNNKVVTIEVSYGTITEIRSSK
jgi:hypothetical protein